MTREQLLLGAIGILVLSTGIFGYLYFDLSKKSKDAEALLTEEKAQLESRLTSLGETLNKEQRESEELGSALVTERSKTTTFSNQIETIQDTVRALEKLQATDPQLLAKYSKVYFLNENYIPSELTAIDSSYRYPEDKKLEIHAQVAPYLHRMLEEAQKDGVNLRVVSAYRSFGTQAQIKSSYKVTYGSGANAFSADQGYSEHQLGTTVDLTTVELGDRFTSIESSPAFLWLTKNAYRYGFVLSYPKGNTYYQYEPWHWRFVGKDLAHDLHASDKHLYDLDQRDISSYLGTLFD